MLAAGMPRPRYQWTYNGAEIAGATASSLTIFNVQPADSGAFEVLLNNGLTNLASRAAMLMVNTNCTCAQILRGPSPITVFPGQTAAFSVLARGYPPPQYQWSSNSVAIIGATNRTLVLPNASSNMSDTVYRVEVSNSPSDQCPANAFAAPCVSTNASAALTVTRRPVLMITEVMAAPTQEEQLIHNDWFELTNGDTNAVNLQGYKFRDSPALKAFNNAFVITNALVVQPGESVIFVKDMTPEEFSRWWGPESLPANLQIYTFSGFSLANLGEVIYLWNPAATDPDDAVAAASFAASTTGMSKEFTHFCDPSGCTTDLEYESILGVNGAFRAAEGGDIGSPGYTSNPPPRLLHLWRDASAVSLKCRVIEGKTNRLNYKNRLSAPMWTALASNVASNSIIILKDDTVGIERSRFYRLEEAP